MIVFSGLGGRLDWDKIDLMKVLYETRENMGDFKSWREVRSATVHFFLPDPTGKRPFQRSTKTVKIGPTDSSISQSFSRLL